VLQQPVQWDLTYDAADQLTSVATTNPLNSLLLNTQTHTFDPAGNMTAENGGSVLGHLGTFTFARQFNQLNQLTGITAPHARTFSYDPEGNTLSDGQREYAWDGENRMIELILNEDQFTRFFYDGLNRCVKIEEWSDGEREEVRHIIWDGLEQVERKNAALRTVRRYFSHGFQTVNGGTTTKYFYSKDHLGSIRTVTNLAGQTVETLSYDPWGRRQNSTGTPLTDFGYNGHYTHSQSNLILAPYRTYDPQTTRWLSRDPIAENGGINLYGYVENNPSNLVDPTGLVESDLTIPYRPLVAFGWAGIKAWQYHAFNWNQDSDSFFHCVTSCQLAKIWDPENARCLGEIREWLQPGPDSDSDRRANYVGISGAKLGKDCVTHCRESGY
jgi:RHS repeat-associated protein